MRNRMSRMALAGIILWGLAGCSGGDSPTTPGNQIHNNTPPALPSVSTMKPVLNFYDMPVPTLDQQTLSTGKPGDALQRTAEDHSNWINGYVRAIFAVFVTYDFLDEPVGAFALAINSVPQKQDDGSYLWTYIFVDGDIEYSVFLYGTRQEDTVAWRMEVSSNHPDHPLDHFVWFSGESKNDDTGGYWQFYTPVDETNGTESIRVDWSSEGPHDHTFMLTVNGSGLDNEGDALTYHEGEDTSSVEFFDASATTTSSVVWNRDGSGSLTVPDYNGGARACWDTHQVNVACE